MKRIAAVAIGVMALVSMMGCVEKAKYDSLKTLNARQEDRIKELEQQLDVADKNAQGLKSQLSEKDSKVKLLQDQLDSQDKKFSELMKAYKDLQEGMGKRGPEGPVVMLPPDLNKDLKDFAAQNPDLVEYDETRGLVRFKSDLLFDKGSDQVKEEAMKSLDAFAGIINKPEAAGFNVLIVGHTDTIPIKKAETKGKHPTNWHLSAHRSIAVMEIMTKDRLDPKRVGIMGFGEYRPVAPNQGRPGNPLNRRVEIFIVPAGAVAPPLSAPAPAAAEPAAAPEKGEAGKEKAPAAAPETPPSEE